MPMEVDWELKDLGKLKEGGFQNTAPKHSPVFINTLGGTNNPIKLHCLMPLPILENGAALKKQEIDFNILQSLAWKKMQAKMATI